MQECQPASIKRKLKQKPHKHRGWKLAPFLPYGIAGRIRKPRQGGRVLLGGRWLDVGQDRILPPNVAEAQTGEQTWLCEGDVCALTAVELSS